jgi:hypothetical protein
LNTLQALLGFVTLNPTYILPVLLRNAKPNNRQFRNPAPNVSISINLVAFQAGEGAEHLYENTPKWHSFFFDLTGGSAKH